MGKQFSQGDYPTGSRLVCTHDHFQDGEIFTEDNVYTVDAAGRLVDNRGNTSPITLSEFELVEEEAQTVELTSLCAQLRVYAAGKCYANRDAYELSLTVQYLTDDTVYLSSAQGKIDANIRQLAAAKLKSTGVKHVKYEHGGLQYTVDI